MFGGKLGGLGDIASLLKNAGKIKEMMSEAQEKLAKIEVEGVAGAGAVSVKMNAQGYALSVSIDDEILKEDKVILQDLIASAINDAAKKIEKEKEALMNNAGMLSGMLTGDEEK
jgi:DNA-binding YbaB/EbfC family protein